ncbi:hypothetical protein BGZ75_005830 [Mortierella antarctica]|nr:hypothetical protein BGZ75_005830 [Mortierella antarctica]
MLSTLGLRSSILGADSTSDRHGLGHRRYGFRLIKEPPVNPAIPLATLRKIADSILPLLSIAHPMLTAARTSLKPVAANQIRHLSLVSEQEEKVNVPAAQNRKMSTAVAKSYPGPINQPSNAVGTDIKSFPLPAPCPFAGQR